MMEIRVLTSEERRCLPSFISQEFSDLSEKMPKPEEEGEHVFSLGALLDGVIVGYLLVREGYEYYPEERYYMLDYIVVDSVYRNQGIAKKMLMKVEEIAKERGISSLRLTSRPSREIARKLYEGGGFTGRDTGLFYKRIGEDKE